MTGTPNPSSNERADELAALIRRVDGTHSLGAGVLAERIVGAGWVRVDDDLTDKLAATIRAYLRGGRDPEAEDMTETIRELRYLVLSLTWGDHD